MVILFAKAAPEVKRYQENLEELRKCLKKEC